MLPRTIKQATIGLAAAAILAGGAYGLGRPAAVAARDAAPAAQTQPAQPGPAGAPSASSGAAVATRSLPDFTAIVRQYGPAVVNVSTVGTMNAGGPAENQQGGDDEDAQQFFRHFGPFGHPRGQLTRGIGSGFIVKSDGVILTNAHVVNGANEVNVKLTDKREFRAKVVGLDKDTDVAVLKIDARDLPVVRLGDAAKVQVGEWVLAIGSPFGFENSATAGVVSARARSLPGEGYVPFLQTDVAVNPGNSGGPLFNLAGEVIGINSQIYSGSGGYMGISFAIPIDVAMKVQKQLVATGKVTRGRLGVFIQDVNQQLARSFGLPRPTGALVSNLEKDSPAGQAGMKAGDVILSVNGEEITGSTDLPPRIADVQPGETVRLGIWRDGKKLDLDVKVQAAHDAAVAGNEQGSPERGRLGLSVRPLSPDEARQADLSSGVVVENVTGPAARAGIQPGDVVLSVNRTAVTSVEQLKAAVAKAKNSVALLVQRGDARIFIPVDLG
jgi:serine protease Do